MNTEPVVLPFTVLIDTAESQPFAFKGYRGDAKHNGRELVVPTRLCALGRYPNSLGDYSIDGMFGQVAIERKSLEDCQSTVLGWESDYEAKKGLAGRRERFEQELANLAACRWPAVIVEASLHDCLAMMPEYGQKSKETNAKIFFRSYLAYCQDYRVPWIFAGSRQMAEVAALRFLTRAWRKAQEEKHAAE